MTTAYKLAQHTVKTVKQSLLCLELVNSKLERLDETQPVFKLFYFAEKSKHPYFELKMSALLTYQHLMRLTKGVSGWDINGKNIAFELDVIKARQLVDGVDNDVETVDLIREWKKRNIKADAAANEMADAFREATSMWSKSSKKAIRDDVARNLKALKVSSCIEVPEIEIQAECRKLVVAIKKLNLELRDVIRVDNTMMNCYGKRQVMNGLVGKNADTALTILMS